MIPERYSIYQLKSPVQPARFSFRKRGIAQPPRPFLFRAARARFFAVIHSVALVFMIAVQSAFSAPIRQLVYNSLPGPQQEVREGSTVVADADHSVTAAPYDSGSDGTQGVVKVYDYQGGLSAVIPNPDSAPGQVFGFSLSLGNGILAIGVSHGLNENASSPGKVYLYQLSSAEAALLAVLESPKPVSEDDRFGYSVSIVGQRLIVGAPGDDTGGTDAGRVYCYQLGPKAEISDSPVILQNPAPASGAHFGAAVAAFGAGQVLVGAPGDQTDGPGTGRAFVYAPAVSSVPVHILGINAASSGGSFGTKVAAYGQRLAVACPEGLQGNGAVCLYDLSSATPTAPLILQGEADKVGKTGRFGAAVSIFEDRLVVGEPGRLLYGTAGPVYAPGKVGVYDLASATPAEPLVRLTSPHLELNDDFGFSVSAWKFSVLVGAPGDNTVEREAGGAFAYSIPFNSTKVGSPVFLSIPSRGLPTGYGSAVAVSEKWQAVAASKAGLVYVYRRSTEWGIAPTLVLQAPTFTGYGTTMAISGSILVVGGGEVRVFDLESATPSSPIAVLRKPASRAGSGFGSAVAISARKIAVGFPDDSTVRSYDGSVWLYDLDAADPLQPQTQIDSPYSGAYVKFGTSLSMDEYRLAVGSPAESGSGVVRIYSFGSRVPDLTFRNPGGAGYFGVEVAFAGSRLLVGAPQSGGGQVYAYDLDTVNQPYRRLKLAAPTATYENQRLALSGSRAVVSLYAYSGSSSVRFYDLDDGNADSPGEALNALDATSHDFFGTSLAVFGDTAVVGALAGGYAPAKYGAAYAFEITNYTIPPVLHSPEYYGSASRSPLTVSFTLPESASPGSVTLSFQDINENTLPRVVTLPGVQAAGTYTFALNVAHPEQSTGGVAATGPSIPDGYYAVALAYQDASGSPAARTADRYVIIDTQPPVILGSYPQQVITVDSGYAEVPYFYDLPVSDTSGWWSEQTPAPYSKIAPGTYSLDFRVMDSVGFEVTVHSTLAVRYPSVNAPEITLGASASTGSADVTKPAPAGPPAGTLLRSFGAPAIDGFRNLVTRVKMTSGRALLEGIHVQPDEGEASLLAYTGMEAPGTGGATFTTFLDPVVDAMGGVAFAARIRGAGIKSSEDQGIWTTAFGPVLELALREGSAVPGLDGARLKSVTSVALREGTLLALVKLQPQRGLVTVANDTALVLLTGEGQGTALLRKGTTLPGLPASKIRSMTVLAPALGSPGQGRWFGASGVLAKVTLANGHTLVVQIPKDGKVTSLLSSADPARAVDPRAQWQAFGVPAQSDTGNVALTAALRPRAGVVGSRDAQVLLYRPNGGEWITLARQNQPIDESRDALRFVSFFDPVVNDDGKVAFVATVRGKVFGARQVAGLFYGTPGDLRLATLGGKITTYAMTGGADSRLVFLTDNRPGGTVGLCVGTSFYGEHRLLLSTGSPLVPAGPVLTGIELLKAIPGSYGAARSYNSAGSIAVLAIFADKTQSLLRIDLP